MRFVEDDEESAAMAWSALRPAGRSARARRHARDRQGATCGDARDGLIMRRKSARDPIGPADVARIADLEGRHEVVGMESRVGQRSS